MSDTAPRSRRVPFLAIVAIWTVFGLWSAQQNALLSITSGTDIESWARLLMVPLAASWFWALLTPLLMWTTRGVRDQLDTRSMIIAAHVGIFLVVHVADAAVYAFLRQAAGTPGRPFTQLLFSVASYNVLTYGVIVMITLSLDYRTALRDRVVRTAQLEAQLAVAQFHALRAQLHPHFLFNSLNAISALIQKDAERAERMLARLSDLLRIAIDTAATPEIRLADEVEFVRLYLEIEQMRYGDRLNVQIDLDDGTLEALVPGMLLQPLVENAVRHGVAPHAVPGSVHVRAERTGDRILIVVSDTGTGVPAAARSSHVIEGVGLRTTRGRLEKLYGSAQDLELVNVPGVGFETRVTLPYRIAEHA